MPDPQYTCPCCGQKSGVTPTERYQSIAVFIVDELPIDVIRNHAAQRVIDYFREKIEKEPTCPTASQTKQ